MLSIQSSMTLQSVMAHSRSRAWFHSFEQGWPTSQRPRTTFLTALLPQRAASCTWAPEVPVVTFSDSDSPPVPTSLNPGPGPEIFKFENPTPVQTPAASDPTEIFPCFYQRNDHAGSCYCRNWKVTPGPGLDSSTVDPWIGRPIFACFGALIEFVFVDSGYQILASLPSTSVFTDANGLFY